jgi:hypothetical protein
VTTPPDRTAELILLGKIHGLVESLKEGQDEQNSRLDRIDGRIDGIDGRLRSVEQKAAISGALSGGAMGVGVALIVEALRQWIKRGGPTP